MAANVPALGEVANFGTDYFLLKIKFLAKYKREFTTKFAISPNACCAMFFYLSNVSIIQFRQTSESIIDQECGFFVPSNRTPFP